MSLKHITHIEQQILDGVKSSVILYFKLRTNVLRWSMELELDQYVSNFSCFLLSPADGQHAAFIIYV